MKDKLKAIYNATVVKFGTYTAAHPKTILIAWAASLIIVKLF